MASPSSFLGVLNFRIRAGDNANASGHDSGSRVCTLMEYMGKNGVNVSDELTLLFSHLEYACKRISALVASPLNYSIGKSFSVSGGSAERDKAKPLDIVANDIVLSPLKTSGKVAVMASEEDDAPVSLADDGPFVVIIFHKAILNSLQSGNKLVASAYALFSPATILCTSFGSGTHAFTLGHSTGDFVPTHPNIKIPPRGQIYSVNDAQYFDWPEGLRRFIDTIRQGKGLHPKKYSARCICSLVADFHRTLLYGGIAMNPRDHLHLVYEANPLSFLAEQAGGRGSPKTSSVFGESR
ncbi:fructose-1,6-bisphosphatase, chloroplastic [Olea europaea subsp. europaea]|uniref:Fructose-1,6-bisphosphatase, chloroplastic n=1 Tax=Olea europaea subsp. europaea TaxID=158383 RepID=A0A8S0PQF0_OLEEU|nr:fructose-1,6-bisphosphatase, chloroplastic [Olea europaea subsp. europaea]